MARDPFAWPPGGQAEWPTLPESSVEYWETNPAAAYQFVTEPLRQAGRTGYHNWLQRQLPRYQSQFVVDLATGAVPANTRWYEWLRNNNGYANSLTPYQDYMNSSPYERGERPSAYVGRARWIL